MLGSNSERWGEASRSRQAQAGVVGQRDAMYAIGQTQKELPSLKMIWGDDRVRE